MMATPERYAEAASVVLVGQFNPAIFQPAWFIAEELLPTDLERDVALDVVSPQFTSFQADWLSLQVDAERFQVSTHDPSAFDALRDLAEGTAKLLRHTPVRAVGINTHADYRLPHDESWRQLHERYAPLNPWANMVQHPRLQSLSVQADRPDAYPGWVQLTLKPSSNVKPGAEVHVNDHFARSETDSDEPYGTALAIDVLTEQWAEVRQRGRGLAHTVVATE